MPKVILKTHGSNPYTTQTYRVDIDRRSKDQPPVYVQVINELCGLHWRPVDRYNHDDVVKKALRKLRRRERSDR
jgi:hypothetical protein